LSTIRHELGNSVNALKVSVDVLRDKFEVFSDEKRKAYLERISTLTERQQRILQAMKAYSGFCVDKKEEIPFSQFWERFMAMVSDKLKTHGIRLIYASNLGPCILTGDKMALMSVMTNILDNAVEALLDADDPTIEIEASENTHGIFIRLRDNGSGIKEKDMEKIFVPLFTTKPGKMGMGLPIARKILSKMDGRIDMERLSEGTEARVWLKLRGEQNRFIQNR
jgi:C4-dicarboxylate-specific signal transduction histidine kinase